jgi:hypothetical protein
MPREIGYHAAEAIQHSEPDPYMRPAFSLGNRA